VAVAALRTRLALHDDPTVAIVGETIVVTLPHTIEGTRADAVWPGSGSAVNLRPVLFCASPAPGSTTTIAEATSDPAETELLPDRTGQLCQVGPSRGDASVFEAGSATAELIGGGWGVTVSLKEGDSGEGVWNAIAAECFAGSEICPSRQLAIEIYGIIQSAPTVNAPTFAGSVQISGAFTRAEATDLAGTINAGGTPTTLAVIESTFTPED
jgi:preprotein translocase subunit SecD